ncbi:hypothetical protein SCHPADRAFT_899873 [Schizopora paradoxa]|uniref:Uncharacterized protein n=1 Tax=Schizopora paradoxa TaxID=27342 RepID=A0A0H2S2Y0_9AGAM|nr:hypothetical protein SCHPADRAFT_899873 [Schizopora paradoxa]
MPPLKLYKFFKKRVRPRSCSSLHPRTSILRAEGEAAPMKVNVSNLQNDKIQIQAPVAAVPKQNNHSPNVSDVARVSSRMVYNPVHERRPIDEVRNVRAPALSPRPTNQPTTKTLYSDVEQLQVKRQTPPIVANKPEEHERRGPVKSLLQEDKTRIPKDPLVLDISINDVRAHLEMSADGLMSQSIFHAVSLFSGNGGMQRPLQGASNYSQAVGMPSPGAMIGRAILVGCSTQPGLH